MVGKATDQSYRQSNFLKQAGILVIAGMICRIIGILYRSPLLNIIGDEGNGYYTVAYNIYTIILLVSSYSIPSAISKVIARYLSIKEYKNAQRIFYCALAYVVIIGGIVSLFSFFGASLLVQSNSVLVLKIFAPTIFFSGLLGVLRGYFQAHKTMVQTSVSQILEQIFNAVVSIVAAYLFIQMVAEEDATTKAIYGAMGSALGTGIGVVIGLLFMIMVYVMNRKYLRKRVDTDPIKEELSYQKITKLILATVTPVILCTFVYNCTTPCNQKIYTMIYSSVKGVSEEEISTMFGVFSGKALVIANIPIAIASAIATSMMPTLSGTYMKQEIAQTNQRIKEGMQTTMLLSIPAAVGLFVLAEPIVQLLFNQEETIELTAKLLRCLSVSTSFYGISTITNVVLQSIDQSSKAVRNAGVAVLFQMVILILLLLFTELNLYALAIVTVVYSFLMCVLNSMVVKKTLIYQQEYRRTFLFPGIAAIVMGVVAWGVIREYLPYVGITQVL